MNATITTQTKLGELLKQRPDETLEVLASFGIIHCTGCAVDETLSIEAACKETKVNPKLVVNALKAL